MQSVPGATRNLQSCGLQVRSQSFQQVPCAARDHVFRCIGLFVLAQPPKNSSEAKEDRDPINEIDALAHFKEPSPAFVVQPVAELITASETCDNTLQLESTEGFVHVALGKAGRPGQRCARDRRIIHREEQPRDLRAGVESEQQA